MPAESMHDYVGKHVPRGRTSSRRSDTAGRWWGSCPRTRRSPGSCGTDRSTRRQWRTSPTTEGPQAGGLVVATSPGGIGTGNGLGGAIVAMVVELIGMVLGGLALARSRRTG